MPWYVYYIKSPYSGLFRNVAFLGTLSDKKRKKKKGLVRNVAFLGALSFLVMFADLVFEELEILALPFLHLVEHLALVLGAGLRVPVITLPLAPVLIVR